MAAHHASIGREIKASVFCDISTVRDIGAQQQGPCQKQITAEPIDGVCRNVSFGLKIRPPTAWEDRFKGMPVVRSVPQNIAALSRFSAKKRHLEVRIAAPPRSLQ